LAPIDAPTLAPYAASKGGVNQLVRTLAAEWAQHNICVKATIGVEVTSFVNIVSASSPPSRGSTVYSPQIHCRTVALRFFIMICSPL
jgi:NAD(P)-dependent dehydrogenase (short-subunit alcohol dehydrogenase family)